MCDRSVSGIARLRIVEAQTLRRIEARRVEGAGPPSWVGSVVAPSSVPAWGPEAGGGGATLAAGPGAGAAARRRPRTRRPNANSGLNGRPAPLEARARVNLAPSPRSHSHRRRPLPARHILSP